MGNTNYSSFLFGESEQTIQSSGPPPHSAEAAAAGIQSEVPSWCKNTADYARSTQGVTWNADMCHSSMITDIDAIVNSSDQYIQYLGPEDEDILEQSRHNRKVVLTSYDNLSNMPGPGSIGLQDDPRWTFELTKRVTEELIKQGRNVSSDKKQIIDAAVKRRSQLSRRTFYDYRGVGSPDVGDINVAFRFSGRA